mmetsp:Transcript_27989/g.68865  ORF Transcript_27989/g.68865 Transcript_27989/m.68865 type:complete len:352 (-) Transcript_27989:114-1169(-)
MMKALPVVVLLALALQVLGAQDYYKTLGLNRGASEDQIKRSYRKLALKYHPDKNQGNAEAANKFAELGNAYGVLSDADKRQVYDRHGEEGVKQHEAQGGRGGGGGSQQDIFSQFFGGGFGGGGFGGQEQEPETPKGDSFTIDLEVSIKDLYLGRTLKVGRDKDIIKPAKGKRKCNCKQKMVTRQLGPGMFQQYAKEECEECENVRMAREHNVLSVEVEPGMPDGHEMLFFEEGEPVIDGDPGDLKMRIKTAVDDTFRRDKNDLYMTYFIDLIDALTGFEKEFAHFDGHKVKLAHTGVTIPGQVETIAGQGMPVHNSHKKFGNLIVTYQVKFPKQLTEGQKTHVKQLFQGTF